jgi:putative membrane protein insertion efficiency factor
MNTLVLALLRFYKAAISPAWPSGCKFFPTCSAYAMEAVERHGTRRGLWLSAARLLRCRPFRRGGYDPVP